jgi:glycosyltransferase involved in cell wall biosynthesis
MKRLAIVASHVIQYQDPFFRLLAKEPDVDLTVIYCSAAGAETYRDEDMKTTLRWDIDLLEGYRYVTLRNFGFGDGYTRLINPGIIPAIPGGRYDAVIFMLGWGSISALLGIASCRISQTPFFLYGDSSFPPPETTLRSKARAAFIRSIFRLATGFMNSGVLNAEYYRHYVGNSATFFLLPWAVDNERFEIARRMNHSERDAMRQRYGIGPDRIVFIFSAKLVPRKDPMTLLRAYQTMRYRDRAAVLFMGDGELRTQLEEYSREHGLRDGVHFAGFVNQLDLPKHYAMCDVFVLPSLYEPRGAVINEAMACGLPVIVTDRCGSIGDIVLAGENAFIYPAGEAEALADDMDRLTIDDTLRERMAGRSREIIAAWDFARGVEGVKAMLRWVEERP